MFSYLRYFAIISTIVITIAAILLGYYFRETAADDVSQLVIENNNVKVQGYVNNVWRNHELVKMIQLFERYDVPRSEWFRYKGFKKNFTDFSRESFRYFEGMPMVKVSIYNAKGDRIISLNQREILQASKNSVDLEDPQKAVSMVRKALTGKTNSAMLPAKSFEFADGTRKSGLLVQTVIPIFSKSYVPQLQNVLAYSKEQNIEGAVEIYYDISDQWSRLNDFQYLATSAIILIFFILIGTLVYIASRAETIIAKQHEANIELAAQAAAAEAENDNKSQFLASISHELRTPLNAIIGFSEIIRNEVMGAIENEQYRDYIKDIHNSGVHLLSLINDILDYSKAEAGKLEMSFEETNITKIIESSMRLIAPRAELAEVRLMHNIPNDPVIIATDAKKFKQVMLNLLSNSVKFTPPDGEVGVTMWRNMVDDSISVEVSDSGIGIAPKDISKALAPFGQVDSALSRKYEGTGLGLPLTKKFIEIMGGTFAIESEEGKGTKITFTLPIEVGTS